MKNPFSLENKTILITGASSGIGRQCAISCSQMGANIILIARNVERLKDTFNQLEVGNHLYYSLDITNYTEIEPIIEDAVSKIGKISGFIHSAGIEMTKPLRMMKPEDYQNLFRVNVVAGFEFARVVTKKKFADENLSLVYISSIMSELGQVGKIGYCSTKSAILGGVKALALELATKEIRVNALSPAVVKTEMSKKFYNNLSEKEQEKITKMHPLGVGYPEDVANACIYLLSVASKWVTGTNLIVDGGYSAR